MLGSESFIVHHKSLAPENKSEHELTLETYAHTHHVVGSSNHRHTDSHCRSLCPPREMHPPCQHIGQIEAHLIDSKQAREGDAHSEKSQNGLGVPVVVQIGEPEVENLDIES